MKKRVFSLVLALALVFMSLNTREVAAAQQFNLNEFGGQTKEEQADGKRVNTYSEIGNSSNNQGAYNGQVYVMYMEDHSYRTSVDGVNWTTPVASQGVRVGAIEYVDGWFYTLGRIGETPSVMSSKDLITWTSIGKAGWMKNLNHDGKILVTHGYGGSHSIIQDGQFIDNFEPTYDKKFSANFEPVWSGESYIIVDSSGNMAYSQDLKSWTVRDYVKDPSGIRYNVHDGLHFNGMAIYKGQISDYSNGFKTGMGIATTTDGINFTTRLLIPYDIDTSSVKGDPFIIGNGIAVVVEDGTYYSEDGIKWTKGIVKGTSGIVANGKNYTYDADYVYTSSDASTWQSSRMTTDYKMTEYLYDFVAGDNGYAAISRYKLIVSQDGHNWTEIPLKGASGKMHWRISYASGKYIVMVATGGKNTLYVSSDLYNWSSKSYYGKAGADIVNAVTYNNQMLSCGIDDDGGVLQSSSNGFDWNVVYKHDRGIGDLAVTDQGILFLDYGDNAFLTKDFVSAQEVNVDSGEKVVHIYSSNGKPYAVASKGKDLGMTIYEYKNGQWTKVSDVNWDGTGQGNVPINKNASVYQDTFGFNKCLLLGENGAWQIVSSQSDSGSLNFSQIKGNELVTIGMQERISDPHSIFRVVTDPIKITIDGELLMGMDVPPTVVKGRTLMPVRQFFEAIQAKVSWDGATRTVKIVSGKDTIEVQIDSDEAMVNGVVNTLDTPAMLINGRTMVPVRFISEALGYDVEWNSQTRMVLVDTK